MKNKQTIKIIGEDLIKLIEDAVEHSIKKYGKTYKMLAEHDKKTK